MRQSQEPSADRFLSIQKGDLNIMVAGGRTSMLCVSFLPIIAILIITFILGGSPLSWTALIYGTLSLFVSITLTLIWWRINYQHYNPNNNQPQ